MPRRNRNARERVVPKKLKKSKLRGAPFGAPPPPPHLQPPRKARNTSVGDARKWR